MNLIEVIKKIGENGDCNEDELMSFLPNFPTLSGSEFIFRVKLGELILKVKSMDEIEDIIKGLHLIELKYRDITKEKFGFGSPTPTYRLLKNLEKKEFDISQKIKRWIEDNGGNYYIKEN
jgi:hypothetical protein